MARARRAGVRGARLRPCATAARLLADAARPWRRGAYVLTGRGAEQHAKGTDTVTAAINLALALGLPGRVGSGYGAITGQGNGQGGREHGQKADQLPGYRHDRRPGRARARGRRCGAWRPSPCRARACRHRAPRTRWAPRVAPGRCSCTAPTCSSARPTPPRSRERLAALDLLVVCDVVPSETAPGRRRRPPGHPVGGGGGHDDLAGGPRDAPPARRRRPRASASELEVWSELAAPARGAGRLPAPTPPRCSTSCARASAGGRGRLQRPEPRPARRRGGPLLALPRRGRRPAPAPGHAAAVPRPLPDAGRPGPAGRGGPPGPAGRRPRGCTALPRHRPGPAALPVRRADPAGRAELAAAVPAPFVEVHPLLARRLGVDRRPALRLTGTRGTVAAPPG